jgi:hypothetical protein
MDVVMNFRAITIKIKIVQREYSEIDLAGVIFKNVELLSTNNPG